MSNPADPVSYRSALTAADVLAAPAAPTLAEIAEVGVFPDVDYYCTVVGVNAYGRTTGTDAAAVINLSAANKVIKVGITQLTGATHYDIYLSADSDPKWVARITEAQRAAGCAVTDVGTVGEGGAVNSAYVYLAGTGLQSGATAAQNTAFVIPAALINCTNYEYCDFDLTLSHEDAPASSVNPSLTVVPAFKNNRTGTWYFGVPQSIPIGGQGGGYESLLQRIRVETRGNPAVALLVAQIGGLSASLDIDYTLS